MAKKILNKTKKQIIKELQKEVGEAKRNITFSLDSRLLSDFKGECSKHGLPMNKVIEKLIAEFLK